MWLHGHVQGTPPVITRWDSFMCCAFCTHFQSILDSGPGRDLPAGLCRRIMQSFRLTKTLWIIKFNHTPKTTESIPFHQLSFFMRVVLWAYHHHMVQRSKQKPCLPHPHLVTSSTARAQAYSKHQHMLTPCYFWGTILSPPPRSLWSVQY